MCFFGFVLASTAPLSAQLSLSVPPLVKKISLLRAPMTEATCARAFSMASLLAAAKL